MPSSKHRLRGPDEIASALGGPGAGTIWDHLRGSRRQQDFVNEAAALIRKQAAEIERLKEDAITHNVTELQRSYRDDKLRMVQYENEQLRAFVDAVADGRHDEFCGPRVADCRCRRGRARELLGLKR